ncbi:MAG: hypothetical protein HY324_02020 [Chlamydiia bacterium]|nr:hypothetical protein [Chlamydiia bacterium]
MVCAIATLATCKSNFCEKHPKLSKALTVGRIAETIAAVGAVVVGVLGLLGVLPLSSCVSYSLIGGGGGVLALNLAALIASRRGAPSGVVSLMVRSNSQENVAVSLAS